MMSCMRLILLCFLSLPVYSYSYEFNKTNNETIPSVEFLKAMNQTHNICWEDDNRTDNKTHSTNDPDIIITDIPECEEEMMYSMQFEIPFDINMMEELNTCMMENAQWEDKLHKLKHALRYLKDENDMYIHQLEHENRLLHRKVDDFGEKNIALQKQIVEWEELYEEYRGRHHQHGHHQHGHRYRRLYPWE